MSEAAEARPAALLAIVDETLRELHAGVPGLPAVQLASRLDRDLGLDSLARMELLQRAERAFGVQLPEDALGRIETVDDLWMALQAAGARPAGQAESAPAVRDASVAEAGEAAPEAAATLLEALDWHLARHPERTQLTCLVDAVAHPLSYRQLAEAADAVAAGLQRAGVAPRQCVAIMLPTCPEYFSTYLGILRAGAIPVPIYPPARPSQLEDHVLRHAGILASAGAVLLVTVPEAMLVARLLQARLPDLRALATPAALAAGGGAPTPVAVRAEDIAFIQYTSGSTGSPKGVALTHANLLANVRAMAAAVGATPRDVFVSWLPLYHDMGLIGAWLGALVIGFPLVVMSPLAFLARPQRWLEAIDRYRGTLSAAPNFAYELCMKRLTDAEVAGLDLTCWRLAFNGAEAVGPDTMERFAQRFAPLGLRREAMTPVYGLAECSVGLLFPPPGRGPRVDRIRRQAFAEGGEAVPAGEDEADALRFVACGAPLAGHAVRLVDEAGLALGERREGRLQFRGPSATQGYYRDPAQTAALIRDGWLDSGDRAYRAGDDIFITGRIKDIVIRGGRNLYPQEIEQAVDAVEGIRKGCVAVFGSPDPLSGTERLVVLAEARPGAAAGERLQAAVTAAVVAAIGEPPDRIVLAPPHTVLKTSSGKVRRAACRELFESGRIGAPAAGAGRQLLRLAAGSALPALRQSLRRAGEWLFAARAVAAFWLLAPPVWLLIALSPRPAVAWAIAHRAARALLRLAGIPLAVEGLEGLPAGPCILACNHASYSDGVLLVAALRRPFTFVAKGELRGQPVARIFLQRLGAEFVERSEATQGVADAARLAALAGAGRSLLLFPEGTFTRDPQLRPFRLGAFLAAAQSGLPLVPLALAGSRQLLPDGSWRPRPARIRLAVLPANLPAGGKGEDFAEAVRLRNQARQAIGDRLLPA